MILILRSRRSFIASSRHWRPERPAASGRETFRRELPGARPHANPDQAARWKPGPRGKSAGRWSGAARRSPAGDNAPTGQVAPRESRPRPPASRGARRAVAPQPSADNDQVAMMEAGIGATPAVRRCGATRRSSAWDTRQRPGRAARWSRRSAPARPQGGRVRRVLPKRRENLRGARRQLTTLRAVLRTVCAFGLGYFYTTRTRVSVSYTAVITGGYDNGNTEVSGYLNWRNPAVGVRDSRMSTSTVFAGRWRL